MAAKRGDKTPSTEAGTPEGFPVTMAAIRGAGKALWGVALAIASEISTNLRGRALHGEYVRLHAFLVGEGISDWSVTRIRAFHSVGRWVNSSARRAEFLSHPFELVRAAKDAARSDDEKALAILSEATNKREILSKKAPKAPTDRGASDFDPEGMADDLHQVASARAQAVDNNGERIVGQVRDQVAKALRALEDVVRAANTAIEHEPQRRADIQVILLRLEERGPELIATAGRAVRATPESEEQLELEV